MSTRKLATVCGCSSRAVEVSVSHCPVYMREGKASHQHIVRRPMRCLGSILDGVPECCGRRCTHLGAEDAAEGVRPAEQRVAREASDRTHLAGKLRATHPGEAHDGGSRGVESGSGVVGVTFGGFRCCKSMMGSCDRP